MTIRDPRRLGTIADDRLENTPQKQRIMLIYCAIVGALSVVTTIALYFLDTQIAGTGGLKHMTARSMLSTVRTILPFAQMLALMVLELGLTAVMLRIGRRQFVSPNTLRAGLGRFWALVRTAVLQCLIYLALGIAAMNVATIVFFLTPLSDSVMELLIPLVSVQNDPYALLDQMSADPALMDSFLSGVLPLYILVGVIFLALLIPVSYRLRMVNYVLMDDPKAGAFRAVGQSRVMMKGNCNALLRVDLGLWWYHVLTVLILVLSYGNLLLPMLGVSLPMSADAAMYLFYALGLIAQLAQYYFLYPKVGTVYALCYDCVRPKEEPGGGAVLGNIFQM